MEDADKAVGERAVDWHPGDSWQSTSLPCAHAERANMLRRRRKARVGELVAIQGATGITLFGEPGAVDRFIDELTSVTGRKRPVGRTLADVVGLGATAAAFAGTTGQYFQLSPTSLLELGLHGATSAGTPGFISGVVRNADGSISSLLELQPVDFSPQQALALQQAATTMALRMAIQEVAEAVQRVEGKLDVLSDLVRSQRIGNAIGDYKFLTALAERVDGGAPLTQTDWSTVEHLGSEITRDIEGLRAFIRLRLADDETSRSTRSRAERLERLAASHLDEMLGALLLSEHNLMTWERLRLARHVHAEIDQIEAMMAGAQRALAAHRDDDQTLVTELEREIDEMTTARGLEGLAPISRRRLVEHAETLNTAVDWFAGQRTLDVTESVMEQPDWATSARELGDRVSQTANSAKGAVVERVRRTKSEPTPELGEGDHSGSVGDGSSVP